MNRRALLATMGLGLAPRFSGAEGMPVPDHAWRPASTMPVKRSEFGAANLEGSIVVAGGFDAGVQVDAFDLASGAWRRLADLPKAVHHPGVASLDGKLYVAGGYDPSDQIATASLRIYDPIADSWSTGADLPNAKGAFGMAAAHGAVFAFGGAAERLGGPASGSVERYDPAFDRWEAVAELPTPREHLAAAACRDAIYTCGGRANGDESATFAAAVERFDLGTGLWRIDPPLPTPRAGLAAVAAGSSIVTAGGERGSIVFATVEAFDLETGIWAQWPSLPRARHGLALALVSSDVFGLGGSVVGGRVQSVDEVDLMPVGRPCDRPPRRFTANYGLGHRILVNACRK